MGIEKLLPYIDSALNKLEGIPNSSLIIHLRALEGTKLGTANRRSNPFLYNSEFSCNSTTLRGIPILLIV